MTRASMSEIVEASCPYCGEQVEVIVDVGGGERQEYVEDCPVCCQPWETTIEKDRDGVWSVMLLTTDE
jgi:uncharacterized Zn finger protein